MNKFGPIGGFHYNGRMYRRSHTDFQTWKASGTMKVRVFSHVSEWTTFMRLFRST